jgi:predicted membrane protein
VPWHSGSGVGDRTYRPTSAAAVQDTYRGGVGDMTVDLTRVPLSGLDEALDIRIDHGVGDLEVVLPRSADVDLELESGLGEVEVFDRDSSESGFFPGTGSRSWTDDGKPEFVVMIHNGVGDVEVSRG